MINKKYLVVLLLILAGAVLGWQTVLRFSVSTPIDSRLRVTVSFYPLWDFAREVGQDKITATNITPAGAEPHDFEPAPSDLVSIQKSAVFIYNGAGLEPWVDRVLPDLQAAGKITVKASQDVDLIPGQEGDESQGYDPHFWLDPFSAQIIVTRIEAALIKVDPSNIQFYHQNADRYRAELVKLDQAFSAGLAACSRHEVITSHRAFGYLARRYGFTAVPIAGLSPDQEPSPADLARVVRIGREKNVKYIFFESLVSPRLAQTLAQEIGAQTLVFDPLEGLASEQIAAGENYLSIQKKNLSNLKLALDCR